MFNWHPICNSKLREDIKVDLEYLVLRDLQTMPVQILISNLLVLAVPTFENLFSLSLKKLLDFHIPIAFFGIFVALN